MPKDRPDYLYFRLYKDCVCPCRAQKTIAKTNKNDTVDGRKIPPPWCNCLFRFVGGFWSEIRSGRVKNSCGGAAEPAAQDTVPN